MKSLEKIYNKKWENVVPYAGAWIEMIMDEHKLKKKACRPLRGDVD